MILVFLLFEPSAGCVVAGSALSEGCATLSGAFICFVNKEL